MKQDVDSILTVQGLTKRYAVTVLENVCFELRPGEIHGLLGANGAGKSTLCKIISGLVAPTAGSMSLASQMYSPSNKQTAESVGVQIVQQELNLIPTLSVAENLFLGRMPHVAGVILQQELQRRARVALERFGLDSIDPKMMVSRLGVGYQQMLEIAGALDRPCRVLILDEPTACLSAGETARLFERLTQLAQDGVGIIYISHRLDEVATICQRVTVLRDGRVVCTRDTHNLTTAMMVELMSGVNGEQCEASRSLTLESCSDENVGAQHSASIQRIFSSSPLYSGEKGADHNISIRPPRPPLPETGRGGEEWLLGSSPIATELSDRPVLLKVEGLTRKGVVNDVSFELHAGERLGIAGLVGSGRTELLRLLFGADHADAGWIRLSPDFRERRMRHPSQAVRAGFAMVTEDRKQNGLLLSQSIRVNASLCSMRRRFSRWGWIRRQAEQKTVQEVCDSMDTRCTGIDQIVEKLSGGNQQKVAIAKWLIQDASIFLFDEPTRGIDVSARQRIYKLFESLAMQGKALVIVSSDLDELLATCDRILVMSAGCISGVFERNEWSHEKIMQAAFAGYSGGMA